MTTTLIPLDPALSPQRAVRMLTISANLLPEEIVAGRRARRSRAWVLTALLVVVLLLAGWYLHALYAKRSATQELDRVTAETTAAQRAQERYNEVVKVRAETTTLTGDLKKVMASDLPYSTLLDSLRTTATATKAKITDITAVLNGSDAASAAGDGSALPSDSSAAIIGKLTIAGTASGKPAVAAFADKLGTLKTVANAYVTTVTTVEKGVVFSLSADITAPALCGRFTTTCGGK
jgi:hypothetical protein